MSNRSPVITLLAVTAWAAVLVGLTVTTASQTLHRGSGRLAVLLTVPVMVHCLYALGFEPATPRALFHSLLGCFFFGAFTAKSLWFFTTVGVTL